MKRPTRLGLGALVIVLLVVIAPLRQNLDGIRYNPKNGFVQETEAKGSGMVFDMSLQFMGLAEMGLRQVVASALWVRADEFFHDGEYEAILPLVRMVTWLDPQQIEVYSTGAWHLDYNFVDNDQRSDRRYIPPAIALLKEGIKNNPEIWDLRFDLGWMHYLQKLKDYPDATLWLKEATLKQGKDINTGETVERPSFVDRMLAHGYENMGDLDKSEEQWKKCLSQAEAGAAKDPKFLTSAYLDVSVTKKNLGILLLRRGWRNGDMAAYKRGIDVMDTLDKTDQAQTRALEAAKQNYAELAAKAQKPTDTYPPIDAHFEATWKKVKPKVLHIEGTLALVPTEDYKGLASEGFTERYKQYSECPANQKKFLVWQNGCRVRIILEDEDYDYLHMKDLKEFDWRVDKSLTLMVDEVAVRNGKFSLDINMNDTEQNSTMYPFAKENYRLVLYFNPQEAPDFIQDRIGWNGEGITDQHYLDTTMIPGVRVLRKEFKLKRSDIL